MKISNLKAIENYSNGIVYSGTGSTNLRAGQRIRYRGMILGLFKTYSLGTEYQFLFHSYEPLPSSISVEITGQVISCTPPPDSLILSEGSLNFVCLHWLNQLTKTEKTNIRCVIFHEQQALPFQPAPSRFLTPYLPDEMIASLPLLDDLSIVSRLCCDTFQPGCFEGSLHELVTNIRDIPNNWLGFVTQSTQDQLVSKINTTNYLFLN